MNTKRSEMNDIEAKIENALQESTRWQDYMEPTVVHFPDTDEVEIVPGPHLDDISWSERGRNKEVLGMAEDWFFFLGMGDE